MSTLKTNTIDVYSGTTLTVTPPVSFSNSVTATTFTGALTGNSTGCTGNALNITTAATTSVAGKVMLESASGTSVTTALTPAGLKAVVDSIGVGGILTHSKIPFKIGTPQGTATYNLQLNSNVWNFATLSLWVHDKSWIIIINSSTGFTPTTLPNYGNNPTVQADVATYPRSCEFATCVFYNGSTAAINFLVSNLASQMYNTVDVVVPTGRLFRVTYLGGWGSASFASGLVGAANAAIKQYYIELLPA